MAAAMKKSLNCDGLNVLQNNGEAAGQTVFHLHVHLIPRYKDDQVNITWKPGEPEEGCGCDAPNGSKEDSNNPTKHEVIQCLTIASYCITVFKDNDKLPGRQKRLPGGVTL